MNRLNFFSRFEILTSFLKESTSEWIKTQDYLRGAGMVRNFKVINEVADIGDKLILDLNFLITRDKDQKLYSVRQTNQFI